MKIRIFYITFSIANLGLILYGIMAIIKPDILLEPFLENVYQFPTEATIATTYLSALYRLLGYFNIIPGVVGLLLVYRYKNKGEDWLLRTAIIVTAFSYLGPLVFDNTVGTIGFFEIIEHLLFLLVAISGFLILYTSRKKEV